MNAELELQWAAAERKIIDNPRSLTAADFDVLELFSTKTVITQARAAHMAAVTGVGMKTKSEEQREYVHAIADDLTALRATTIAEARASVGATDSEALRGLTNVVDLLLTAVGELQDTVGLLTARGPLLKDAGIWASGQSYERGDVVTFSGSMWVATKSHTAAGLVDHLCWRLLVKRGKDGRDLR